MPLFPENDDHHLFPPVLGKHHQLLVGQKDFCKLYFEASEEYGSHEISRLISHGNPHKVTIHLKNQFRMVCSPEEMQKATLSAVTYFSAL